jgi:hypothetical protein
MDSTHFVENRWRIKELARANKRIAIHACLDLIFTEVVKAAPKLIVELGVSREALANKALVAAAELFGARVVSCDLYDFSDVCDYPLWSFCQEDAKEFGLRYGALREAAGNPPNVDVILIDADEKYETTRGIIRAWLPSLAPSCVLMFRCTNLAKILHYADGSSTDLGWDNGRGVIRAIEEEFGIRFDETGTYEGTENGWQVKHIPWGAGLTVLRMPE